MSVLVKVTDVSWGRGRVRDRVEVGEGRGDWSFGGCSGRKGVLGRVDGGKIGDVGTKGEGKVKGGRKVKER